MAAIVSKLDNLGRDMKKLKENFHAIQVGCQLCDGPHLDKECPLNKDAKSIEDVKYYKGRSSPFNGTKCRVRPPGYYTRLLAIDLDIFTYDIDIKESYEEIVYRCCVNTQGEPGIEKTENETGRAEEMWGRKIDAILDTVLDKLDDSWLSGTTEDEDDLDGITDYLEPTSYHGFINSSYNKEVEFEVISTHNHVVKMLLQVAFTA
nr:hypothetical protein [Tanacetum cinerariifolium]